MKTNPSDSNETNKANDDSFRAGKSMMTGATDMLSDSSSPPEKTLASPLKETEESVKHNDSNANDSNVNDDQDFELHLPDLNQLMFQRPNSSSTTSSSRNSSLDKHVVASKAMSLGSTSVKSQYYHSSCSQIDSEADLSIADSNDDYESLFSDDVYLSVEEDPDREEEEEEEFQTPKQAPPSNSKHSLEIAPSSVTATTDQITPSSSNLSPAASMLLGASHHSDLSSSLPQLFPSTNLNNASSTRSDQTITIDFLKDDPKTMTYSRRIALWLMDRYYWYNPKMKPPLSNNNSKPYESVPTYNQSAIGNNDVEEAVEIAIVSKGSLSRDDNYNPVLEQAWVYWEHITLARRLVDINQALIREGKKAMEKKNKKKGFKAEMKGKAEEVKGKLSQGNRKLAVAKPGEDEIKTKLYSPITTPLNQMGDFGLGVGLYFGTLRAFTVLLIIAGLMNIPNIIFFSGEQYSRGQEGINWMLKGSAACSRYEWVPCIDCVYETSQLVSKESYRIQNVKDAVSGREMTFVLKTMCDGALFRVGMVNFGTVLLVIVGMIVIAMYLNKKHVDFDLDEQTASDYSITIRNPPKDASDPNEWKDFFEKNFPDAEGMHVASCTVAVDNDDLLDCLVQRRQLLKHLKQALPDIKNVKDVRELEAIAAKIKDGRNCFQRQWAKLCGGVPAKYEYLLQLNAKIKKLSQVDSPVTRVFVMFETEKAQRYVLEKLTVSRYDVKMNKVTSIADPKHLFPRDGLDDLVLDVCESGEPSTIRWKELNLTMRDLYVKLIVTLFVFGIIALVAFIIKLLNDKNSSWAAMGITIGNIVFPLVAKIISKFERHSREEEYQVWLYFKIAVFRWVNTALVIAIIVPFSATIIPIDGVLPTVYKIFFAEIITSNLIQLLDPVENIKRHYLAPRQDTQEKMNNCFLGATVFLAERYTNLTKIVFLALLYCPIYPSVLFMGAIALWINYFTDRFGLMRTWRRMPKIGESISRYTKLYVFPVMVIIMTFFAVWVWKSYRFDYVCDTANKVPSEYYGNYTLNETDILDDFIMDRRVTIGDNSVYSVFCATGETMTESQNKLVTTYENASYTIYAIVGFVILMTSIFILRSYFVASYEPNGKEQGIPLSEVESMTAYIPQISCASSPYPYLACNIDDIEESDKFEWEDPLRPYEYYDITKDAEELLDEDGIPMDESKRIFSKIIYWEKR